MDKKWKRLEKEIARLKHKKYKSSWKIPFPDLSIKQHIAPLGNQFAPISGKRNLPADANLYPTGFSHKQGTQLITPGMIQNGELQWMSGKKT